MLPIMSVSGIRGIIVREYGWVHIRPSNTEPIIRCHAEATTIELANQLVTMVIDKI
jgi:phosphomannomutase